MKLWQVNVKAEGQPTEEPPADTPPDVNQILEAVVPAPNMIAPIPEENDSMDTTIPEVAESGPETRLFQFSTNHVLMLSNFF